MRLFGSRNGWENLAAIAVVLATAFLALPFYLVKRNAECLGAVGWTSETTVLPPTFEPLGFFSNEAVRRMRRHQSGLEDFGSVFSVVLPKESEVGLRDRDIEVRGYFEDLKFASCGNSPAGNTVGSFASEYKDDITDFVNFDLIACGSTQNDVMLNFGDRGSISDVFMCCSPFEFITYDVFPLCSCGNNVLRKVTLLTQLT